MRKKLLKAALFASSLPAAYYLYYKRRPLKSVFENVPSEYSHKIYSEKKPISSSEIPSRLDSLSRLKSGEEFDVLVIGGGCTGSGVALDATTRGLNVALIEKNDYSSGTSSRSTKLIHGGVRYLEKAFKNLDVKQLNLVTDALAERKHLISISPNLSYDIPIIVPLYYKFPEILFYVPYFMAGMKMYDVISGKKNRLNPSYFMRRREVIDKFPMLNEKGLKGAIVYYDGMHNDARMNLGIALTAAQKGAAVTNHVELIDFNKDSEGKICGALCRDNVTGDVFKVKSKTIVNATGCFSDKIRKIENSKSEAVIEPSAGVHIVLSSKYSPERFGMLIPNTDDHRVLFMLPWENSTIAGTTDSSCEIKEWPSPTEKEVGFVVKELKKYLKSDLSVKDINASWSGIRPLVRDKNVPNTASISRDHVIEMSKSGVLTISGGKWTTYRKMAEDVVDRLLKENKNIKPKIEKSVTKQVPLVGASGWSLALKDELTTRGYREDIAEHLSHNYGFLAYEVADLGLAEKLDASLIEGYPFIEAEVLFGIRAEHAINAVDVLARRMRLAFLNSEAARHCLPRVLEIMAQEKKWNGKRRAEEYFRASCFLDTMNVQSCKRHDWKVKIGTEKLLVEIEKAFGQCPISKDDADLILKSFSDSENYITIDRFEKEIQAASVSQSNVRKHLPKMKRHLNERKKIKLAPEEYIIALSASIILDQ